MANSKHRTIDFHGVPLIVPESYGWVSVDKDKTVYYYVEEPEWFDDDGQWICCDDDESFAIGEIEGPLRESPEDSLVLLTAEFYCYCYEVNVNDVPDRRKENMER